MLSFHGSVIFGLFVFDIFPQKGELPAGNAAVSSVNKAFPYSDAQIEKELNDLRQKSKDL